jgi:hypothetical protein
MCNITIYFYNIRIKTLSKTFETLEKHMLATCIFSVNSRYVEFVGDSDPAMLVGSGSTVAAQQSREAATARQGKKAAVSRRAWQSR